MLKINRTKFGNLADGREVALFTLENSHGVKISVTNFGAIITCISAPDKEGNFANIVCGFEKLEHYLDKKYQSDYPYLGAVCGRVANRIANGRFTLEGKAYQLAVNNGPNHLHGGKTGFDRRLWTPEIIESEDKVSLKLTYLSPDSEENYPGNLTVECIYSLNDDNELSIEYSAQTDKATIVNLTNHTYFNLTGGKEKIMQHELLLAAEKYTEADDMIPTG
ncbi:MAG: galactose mutarotase, partial [Prolixibacteraceae bacterium]|nr:galactose mutarotase [Prolixibacteraceae bacterium]